MSFNVDRAENPVSRSCSASYHDLLAVSPQPPVRSPFRRRDSTPPAPGSVFRNIIIITGDFFPLFLGLRASKQDPVASLFDETHPWTIFS